MRLPDRLPRLLALCTVAVTLSACTTTAGQPSAPAPVVTKSADGVSVEAPPGAFPKGTTVRITPTRSEDPGVVAPTVQISTSDRSQPQASTVLRFPPQPADESAHIAYYDETSGWWLPVETTTDRSTGELIAGVDHFSLWTKLRDRLIEEAGKTPVGVQQFASWVEYQTARILGNRGGKPHCSGKLPPWVAGEILTVEDDNAPLFACGEARDGKLALRVVNNRGYPVTLEFDHNFATAAVDLPGSFADLVMTASNLDKSHSRVFLPAKGAAEVRFSQPAGAGVVAGRVRRDAGTLLTNAALDLALSAGGDIPVGGGKTLGVATLDCYAKTFRSVPDTADAIHAQDAGVVGQLAGELRGCVDNVLDGEMARAVPGSGQATKLAAAKRFVKALDLFSFEQYALDAFVNDAGPEASAVAVSFRWKPLTNNTALVPLYQLTTGYDAIGESGQQAPSESGASATSTSFWVGCEGLPATTTFGLNAKYSQVTGTLALVPFVPGDLQVRIQLSGDGRVLKEVTLSGRQTTPLNVDVKNTKQLILSAQAVAGTCGTDPVGYGVASETFATR